MSRAGDGGPANTRPDPWADLAGQVSDLAGQQRQLAGDVAEMGGQLADLRDGLEQATSAFSGDAEGADEPAVPQVDWRSLTRKAAEQAWSDLYEFTHEVLCETYEVTRDELPDCWPCHRSMRNELSWLRVAYEQAIRPHSPGGQLAEWHTSFLGHALARIKSHADRAGCMNAKHRGEFIDDQVQVTGAPSDWDAPSQREFWLDSGRVEDLDSRQ